MHAVQAAVSGGTFVETSKKTVAQYLTGDWLPAVDVRPGTWDAYELHCRRYIVPRIGTIPLQELSRNHVKALYLELRESGRVRGTGGLSGKTVHNVHLTLHKALADAVEDRVIPRNPAEGAHRLPPERPEMSTWTAQQLRDFLLHVQSDEFFGLWRLAATTGLRRGEVLALRWKDIDLEGASLSVNQQRVKGSRHKQSERGQFEYRPRRLARDAGWWPSTLAQWRCFEPTVRSSLSSDSSSGSHTGTTT